MEDTPMQRPRNLARLAHRNRLLVVGLLVALVAPLLLSCGGDEESGGGSGGGDKEAAETYLRKTTGQLDTVLADYRSGKKTEAHDLAETIGHDYEGVPEETVAEVAPEINRQLDPLIEASLPGALEKGQPVAEIETLVQRAKTLITEALEKIEASEG
jgi:hypothetical protein